MRVDDPLSSYVLQSQKLPGIYPPLGLPPSPTNSITHALSSGLLDPVFGGLLPRTPEERFVFSLLLFRFRVLTMNCRGTQGARD